MHSCSNRLVPYEPMVAKLHLSDKYRLVGVCISGSCGDVHSIDNRDLSGNKGGYCQPGKKFEIGINLRYQL